MNEETIPMITTSSATKNIMSAILAIQSQVPTLVKDKHGVHGSKYADLAQIMDKLGPLLTAQQLVLMQGGNHELWETRLCHISGEFVAITIPFAMQTNKPHEVGSGITYFRRYGIMALLGLVAEDDDGNAAQGITHTIQQQNYQAPASGDAAVIHFGKNKGKPLYELSDNQVSWYVKNYDEQVREGKKLRPDDERLRQALNKEMSKRMGKQEVMVEPPPQFAASPDEIPF